jgi:hypothetical protein
MKKLIYLSTITALFISCTAIKPTMPNADYDTEIPQIDSLVSKINLPIKIDVKKIEQGLNKLYPVGKRIYEIGHTEEEDNSRISHIRVDVRKKISVTTNNGFLEFQIPLVTDIRYEWWWWVIGFKYSDYIRLKALETNVTIKVRPKFDKDWSFNPDVISKVRLNSDQGFLSFLLNFKLWGEDGKISEDVKKAIVKSIDIRSEVEKEYQKLSPPILLSEDIDSTWLSFKPIKFNFSPPVSNDNILNLNFALNSNILVHTGKKPEDLDLSILPDIDSEQNYDNSLNLLLKYNLSLNTLEKELNKELLGEYPINDKRNVKVKEIKVLGINQNLALKIKFKSKCTYGWLYVVGKLAIDDNQTVFVKDLKFSTATNNLLLNKAVWLADLLFIKKIEEKSKYSIKKELEKNRIKLNEDLSNIITGNSIKINASIDSLNIEGIYIEDQSLVVIPNAVGKINIEN